MKLLRMVIVLNIKSNHLIDTISSNDNKHSVNQQNVKLANAVGFSVTNDQFGIGKGEGRLNGSLLC